MREGVVLLNRNGDYLPGLKKDSANAKGRSKKLSKLPAANDEEQAI